MKFLFNASGANTPLIRDYDIASATCIYKGQVVGVKNSLIVSVHSADYVVGVAEEDHTGTADMLNPRNNGTKIRVNMAPDAVYTTAAPNQYVTTGSTATKICISALNVSSGMTSGSLVLVSKGSGSTNTDKIGKVRTISACSVADNVATVTVSSGGTACSGDVYAYVPHIGTDMTVDLGGMGVVQYDSSSTVKAKVVFTDAEKLILGVKLKTPYLA